MSSVYLTASLKLQRDRVQQYQKKVRIIALQAMMRQSHNTDQLFCSYRLYLNESMKSQGSPFVKEKRSARVLLCDKELIRAA